MVEILILLQKEQVQIKRDGLTMEITVTKDYRANNPSDACPHGFGQEDTIRKLFTCSTRGNLFDSHPPFQIDGNFGASAAIAEALVQSHNGRVTLLPACPDEFARGSMRGICLRGGAMLDARWENGRVTSCKITAARGDFAAELCVNGETRTLSLKKGEVFSL